jgi:hypothetical protein
MNDEWDEALEDLKAKAKNDYYRFIAEVEAINPDWVDETCDQENSIEHGWGTLNFWETMLASAKMSCGMRAEDVGQNINILLGRNVY